MQLTTTGPWKINKQDRQDNKRMINKKDIDQCCSNNNLKQLKSGAINNYIVNDR